MKGLPQIDPSSSRPESMQLSVELESEAGWLPVGELTHLPGVVGVDVAREEALAALDEIALQVMADEWMEETKQDKQKSPFRIPIDR